MSDLVDDLSKRLRAQKMMLATAESCTGGLIGAAMTALPGSSDIYDRGFITYSNAAKTEILGVEADLIATLGAVSAEVAEAMASGALQNSAADIAVSVTGIAGPGGGSDEKPVGLVYIGFGTKERVKSRKHIFEGSREDIRLQTADQALRHVFSLLKD